MKTLDVTEQRMSLVEVLELAKDGPIVLIASDGREYVLAEAEGFDDEVAALRASDAFQQFLDERTASRHERRSLLDVLRDVEHDVANERAATP